MLGFDMGSSLCALAVWLGARLIPDLLAVGLGVTATVVTLEQEIEIATGAGPVVLVFAGDVMPAANLPPYHEYDPQPLDYAFLFERVAPYLRSADVAFCNLESPISGRGQRVNKRFAFNAPPEAAAGVAQAGFDIVSLANNHSLDYGPDALADTMAHLDRCGIQHAGLSVNGQPQEPVVIKKNGVRIGYLAYQPRWMCPPEFLAFPTRPAAGDKDRILADVAALRDKADVIVVSLHWGVELSLEHDAKQTALAHALIDAGVDIVAGHHPHVQQPPERYKRGLILYSMGNLVFARWSPPPARKTRLYRVYATRNGIDHAEYLPIEIAPSGQPKPTSEAFVSLTGTAVAAR